MDVADPGHTAQLELIIGARMRTRRRQLGLSQSDLAERLGVSFQQVQKYERGANRISASMLVRTARALQCPGAYLLGGSIAIAAPVAATYHYTTAALSLLVLSVSSHAWQSRAPPIFTA